jgi:hypothetical protein
VGAGVLAIVARAVPADVILGAPVIAVVVVLVVVVDSNRISLICIEPKVAESILGSLFNFFES